MVYDEMVRSRQHQDWTVPKFANRSALLIIHDSFAMPARWYRGLRFSVLLFLFGLFASAAAAATGTDVQSAPVTSIGPGPSFAIADFDRDQRPDIASVGQIGFSSTNYSIRFLLTGRGLETIQLVAPPGGLQLEARDVNGDQAVDLVVTTAWFKQPVAVLLNDGHGGFSRAEPSEFPGAFTDSKRNLNPSSERASETIGIPPQPRPGICCEAANLPDVRGPTDAVPASHAGFALESLLIGHAGRAPPAVVSYHQ